MNLRRLWRYAFGFEDYKKRKAKRFFEVREKIEKRKAFEKVKDE